MTVLPRKRLTRDLREDIFKGMTDRRVTAVIVAMDDGVVAGIEKAKEKAHELGLQVEAAVKEGADVKREDIILRVRGNPKQIALAEDTLIGVMSKTSGIATATRKAVRLAGENLRVVSGAWKKMPQQIKDMAREAVAVGGASPRIAEKPFIYLDKNYVRIFGGVRNALKAAEQMKSKVRVVQLKGATNPISEEAVEAVRAGANIIMVDTGNPADIGSVARRLTDLGLRDNVKIAFAGGVKLEDIRELRKKDVDIVEIGRNIVDAPLLDMRLDVVKVEDAGGK